MKLIILYLLTWLALATTSMLLPEVATLPAWTAQYIQVLNCSAIGAIGGVLYCLRGVYINRSARDSWSANWETWYYLRPIASAIGGTISFLFLKAGIIFLDATSQSEATGYGYYAVAFLAGYNVDNFLRMIEQKSKSVLGVKESNATIDKKDGQ